MSNSALTLQDAHTDDVRAIETAAMIGAARNVDFQRVRQLALDAKAANEASSAWFGAHWSESPEYGTEDYIRREIEKTGVVRRAIAAEKVFHKACEEFFLTAAERGQ